MISKNSVSLIQLIQFITINLILLYALACNAVAQDDMQKLRQRLVTKDFLFEYCIDLQRENSKVAKELALVPSQLELIKPLLKANYNKRTECERSYDQKINKIRSNEGISLEQRISQIQKLDEDKVRELNSIADSSLGSFKRVLIPGQFEQLKQLGMQYRLKQEFPAMGLAAIKPILLEIELTDETTSEIHDLIKSTQAEFEAERDKLRKEYEQKAKQTLPISARKKLQNLIGDFYYFHSDR